MKFDDLGWLDVATEVNILGNTFDRQGHQPRFIIVHGTAGGTSAIDVANYMKGTVGGSNPVSTHFVIGQDGTIVQCVPVSLAAFGNGVISGTPTAGLGFRTAGDGTHRDDWWDENVNPNFLTVSIEHCKPSTDNSDILTPAQQAASFALIQCICDTYGIPKRFADAQGGVTGHFSVDPVNRSRCPGPYPWQELFNYLTNGRTKPMQPNPNQQKAADDCWDSVLKDTAVGLATKGSSIYQQWLAALIQGKQYGPPLTHEYDSVDWNGNHIVVQEFARARCEWDGSVARWYGPTGQF